MPVVAVGGEEVVIIIISNISRKVHALATFEHAHNTHGSRPMGPVPGAVMVRDQSAASRATCGVWWCAERGGREEEKSWGGEKGEGRRNC